MKYEIVEFTPEKIEFNDKFFGIRRRNFFENLFNYGGDYFDFANLCYNPIRTYFWKSKSAHFADCKTKDINLLYYTHARLCNNVVNNVIK